MAQLLSKIGQGYRRRSIQNVIDTGTVGQFDNFFGPVWVGTRIYTSPSTELERLGEFVLTSRSNDYACADRLRNLQSGKCNAPVPWTRTV